MTSTQIRPAAGALGAYVTGLDLAGALSAAQVRWLRTTLAERGVLFFRDQAISPAQLVAVGRHFGPLQVHPVYPHPDGAEAVAILEHTAERPSRIEEWHTDMTFRQRPPLGSILHAKITPTKGGDTLWSSMGAAYDGLSEAMRAFLEPLRAEHSFAYGFRHSLSAAGGEALQGAVRDNPPVSHPVVRVHPVTGRKGLFVNQLFTTHIIGLAAAESRAILDFLFAHANRPEYTARFTWAPNSVAFWDNRATQHRPVNDHGLQHRKLHRVTIEGDRPRGPMDEAPGA